MTQLIQLIKIIESLNTSGWMYVAVMDEVTCQTCLDFEQQLVFTEDELPDAFPDMQWLSNHEIYPDVHMTLWNRPGQCRCRLFPYAEDTGEGGGGLPKVPKHVTDEEFDDWLTGLLSAGYITAAIYDKIVDRRKKKKKNEAEK
mgnify:CR=1 FL=1